MLVRFFVGTVISSLKPCCYLVLRRYSEKVVSAMETPAGDAKKKEPALMRAVIYEPGGPENLSIGSVVKPSLRPHDVLIKVYATAINRADTLQRKGNYPPPPGESELLGLEAVGVIEKCSPESTKWKEGDRVMALLGGGGYAEYVNVHENLVIPVPKGMSLTDAAAIPETWLTAYQLLHLVGNVRANDKVLIHAAGSGVGLAAIQLAKMAMADVYVTAGAQSKLDAALSFGAIKGFNYKEGPFSEAVLAATQGRGVDLILDCIGGSFWEQNGAAVAQDGRWVLYGTLGTGNVNGSFLSTVLFKRVRLQGTTLRTRPLQYKANLVSEFTANVIPQFESGKLKPVIDCKFPMGKIVDAHRHMEADKNIGKIVLLIRPDIDEVEEQQEP